MFRSVRVHISGQVQGVGFRFFVHHHAMALKLKGEVWNTRDGSVEVYCEGEKSAVDRLIQECYHGPPASRVTSVSILEDEVIDNLSFKTFSIVSSR